LTAHSHRYPVAYVILVLPIAAVRWSETYGAEVPFGVTIFADTVFLLSGTLSFCPRFESCSI
jgi:hypothetical protein